MVGVQVAHIDVQRHGGQLGPGVHGQKVLTLLDAMPRETDFKQNLCADNNGFSLHAAVRCGTDER